MGRKKTESKEETSSNWGVLILFIAVGLISFYLGVHRQQVRQFVEESKPKIKNFTKENSPKIQQFSKETAANVKKIAGNIVRKTQKVIQAGQEALREENPPTGHPEKNTATSLMHSEEQKTHPQNASILTPQ